MPSQADRDRRDPRQARQCRLDQSLGQKTANPSLPRQRKRPLPICRTPLPRRAREAQTSRQNGKSLGSLRARASRQSAIRARARPRHDFPCRTARPDRWPPQPNEARRQPDATRASRTRRPDAPAWGRHARRPAATQAQTPRQTPERSRLENERRGRGKLRREKASPLQ